MPRVDRVSVNRNLAASALGNTWTALVQVVFIPVYIGFLGLEAYGLIGVYAFLQAVLGILDMGLGPALSREAARASAGAQAVGEVRRLLRSAEMVFLGVALVIALAAVLGAPWLVERWLKIEALAPDTAIRAVQLMGALVALRLFVGPHRGVITGCQQLVWLNATSAAFATLRGVGVIGVLAWYSPSIVAFFAFQCGVTVVEAALLAGKAWSLLPSGERATFSAAALARIRTFSGGVALITVLYLMFSQVDKLLLSTLLPLTAFGYYALASSVAGALNLLIAPIGSVAYPRLNELAARADTDAFAEAFHQFAQMVTLAVAPAALVLALFSSEILAFWTGDPAMARTAAALLSPLAIGAMLNAFMGMPYLLPMVHGHTRGLVEVHLALVAIFVPAIYAGVSAYGALAAAHAWVAIHATGLALALPLMRGHIRAGERRHWLLFDVALPACAALLSAVAVRQLAGLEEGDGAIMVVMAIVAAYAAALLAASLALPIGRRGLARAWGLLAANGGRA